MQRITYGLVCNVLLSLQLVLLAGIAVRAPLESQSAQPYPEVRYERQIKANPAQQLYVVRVDLTDPDVEVRVAPGGVDPDGAGEYQTTLQTLSTIAERERFEVAVNGDFFSIKKTL